MAAAPDGALGSAPVKLFQVCYGKEPMPTDTENKAKTIRMFSIGAPYMRAFHRESLSSFCA
jgi:hypothetical protein